MKNSKILKKNSESKDLQPLSRSLLGLPPWPPYRLSPQERWHESEKLWQSYFYLGGSLDTQPYTQSPFFDPEAPSAGAWLIGGQACLFYGAAEFSRDTDLAILASPESLARHKKSLTDPESRSDGALRKRTRSTPALQDTSLVSRFGALT